MITDPFTEEIRKENEDLKARLAALEARLNNAPLDDYVGEKPMYRLLKPFYGPNDCYYDPEEGQAIINYTGTPNEHMEPINDAAKARTTAWLESLPGKGVLPIEDMVSAAAKFSHLAKDMDLAEFSGKILGEALKMRNQRMGIATQKVELSIPHAVDDVPLTGADRRIQSARKASTTVGLATPPADVAAKMARRFPKKVMGTSGPAVSTEGAIDIG